MIFAAWIAALGLLTLFFDGWLENQRNPNDRVAGRVSERGEREVVLRSNRAGHFIATGHINGRATEFLVDTGATAVAISATMARELGLRPGTPIATTTASGMATAYSTVLDHIGLGGIELHRVRAMIMPEMPGRVALLGMSFLKRVEMVQRDNVLILRQHP